MGRTPAGMDEGGVPKGNFYHRPQHNPMAETGRTNPVDVVERVNPCKTRLNFFVIDTNGMYRYPWDRSYGGRMEGDGGSDRYPD